MRDSPTRRSVIHPESSRGRHLQAVREKYQGKLNPEPCKQVRVDRSHRSRNTRRAKQGTIRSRPPNFNTERSSPLVLTRADGPMGQNLYQALKASTFATGLVPSDHSPKPAVVLLASLENGIGSDAFKTEMETYGKMEPGKVVEDLKKRAKAGKVTEASQKPNRLALDDAKTDFAVVSPNAPTMVKEFLSKTRMRFYRTIDDALRSLDSKLYEQDVGMIPYGSSTIPVAT